MRPARLRDGYLEALEEYLTEVRRGCTRIGVDYQLVRTGDYLDAVLTKFLHHRMDDAHGPGGGQGARAAIKLASRERKRPESSHPSGRLRSRLAKKLVL